MSSWNRSRGLNCCPPDCSERVPGCHGYCKRYKEAKANHAKRKLEYYGDPMLRQYTSEKLIARRDAAAKKAKNHRLSKRAFTN